MKELGGKIVSVNDYTLFSAPENVRNIIVIEKVKGIKCGFKETSCPDQLAKALEEASKEN